MKHLVWSKGTATCVFLSENNGRTVICTSLHIRAWREPELASTLAPGKIRIHASVHVEVLSRKPWTRGAAVFCILSKLTACQ